MDWKPPMNEYHGILDVIKDFASELALVALAVMGATARFIMVPPRASLGAYLRGITLAVCTVWVVNHLGIAAGLSDNLRLALLGVAAFIADDILYGLINVGARLRTDPKGLIEDIKQLFGR